MRTRPWMTAPLLFAACGGYTDEGDGTKTLRVEANVVYRGGGANEISAVVDVTKSGDPVVGADVRLIDGDTDEVLELTGNAPGMGNESRYSGTLEGYHRRLALEVKSGDDELDAKLEGPGRHTILEPKNNDSLTKDDIGDELDVEWSVEDGIAADQVVLVLDTGQDFETVDNGHYDDIPGDEVPRGSRTLDIRRTNRVLLAGGTTGSIFELGYQASNDFVVE